MDKLLINGIWVVGSGPRFESKSPSDESVVWEGAVAAETDVNAAFEAARDAFPKWFSLPPTDRIDFCQKFAQQVEKNAAQLIELIGRETGKPLWEARTEVAAVVGKINLSIDSFRQRRNTSEFEMGATRAVTRFKPHGVCAVLGPYNFPAHLPNGHIVPALIAGNTIVFKPSEQTPAVAQWMCQQWQHVGLPAGVINLVQGSGETGKLVSLHPELDGLFFTGSSRVGKTLHRAFGDHPQKILALEMGGNNPLLVHQVQNLSAAAYATILSAYFTSGQRCTCARRLILVDDPQGRQFIDELIRMISQVSIGFFNDQPQPFMGTVISAHAGQQLLRAQADLVAAGGELILPMQPVRDCQALLAPGLIDVTSVANRSDEEIFGPLLNLIWVPSFDAAIEEANRSQYGLSAGLLSDSADHYQEFLHRIRAGIVNWNRQTTGASGRMPFGGCGLSGNHRPSAWFAADYCSYPVASLEAAQLTPPEKPEIGLENCFSY